MVEFKSQFIEQDDLSEEKNDVRERKTCIRGSLTVTGSECP